MSDAKTQTLLELQRQALGWFELSLEQPDAQRDAWLDEHCTDSAVRARVRSLQTADVGDDDFLDAPHSLVTSATMISGTRVGAYCIDRLLAEGGMGSVYLAHRDDGVYRQQVAIKFLHPLWRHRDAKRRFAAERQILAQLQHPHIAQMLDGGTSDDGVPYVVMEYVDGLPITQFCREHHLGLKARLDLFRQVCSAVAAAHRALVVHRDLKPANILVTGDGRPMLLDFGIAKILATDADTQSGDRATTVVALTPAYASPEQIQSNAITTSSDIYSLGVLLYELLCGRRPYELDGLTPARSEQLVCDTVPPLPSQMALSTPNRNLPAGSRRLLRGDLDIITMKALRKEPERRYGSAQELSEDVHRFLRGLPINARGDSLRYRVAKFTQRNRWGVLAACMVMVSLVVGMIVAGSQAHRATQAARQALAQKAKAEKINAFYKNVFMSPSAQWLSSYGKGANVSIDQVLDFAGDQVDIALQGQPALKADVLDTLSQAFLGMGLYDKAQNDAKRALDVAQTQLAVSDPLRATAHFRLAQTLYFRNEYKASAKQYRRAIALGERAFAPDAEILALMHNDLSVLYGTMNRLPDAERELAEALRLQRQRAGNKPRAPIAIGLSNIGFLRLTRGDLDPAKQAFDDALAMFDRLPRQYAESALTYANLSILHSIRGEFAQAESDEQRALAIGEKFYGRSHPYYGLLLVRHVETALDVGHSEGIAGTLTAARQIIEGPAGSRHPGSMGRINLDIAEARWLMSQRKYTAAASALESAREMKEMLDRKAGVTRRDRKMARILGLLGKAKLAQHKPAEARKLLAQTVEMETALYGPDVHEVRYFNGLLEQSRDATQ